MEQKEAVMVLFDREEEYARLLSEFLRRQKELPWEIHTYTKMEELLEREKNGKVTMLVVAESSCMDTLSTLEPACQAILNESGTLRFHQFPNINKYQEADKVWKELLELYVETVGTQLPFLCAEYKIYRYLFPGTSMSAKFFCTDAGPIAVRKTSHFVS